MSVVIFLRQMLTLPSRTHVNEIHVSKVVHSVFEKLIYYIFQWKVALFGLLIGHVPLKHKLTIHGLFF